ncbi:hypothetical protein D3C76_1856820 [compost metagenome]
MDQIQIKNIESKLLAADLKSLQCRFVALVPIPQLSRNEQFFPGHTGFTDSLSDTLFILISGSRINTAVACL